MDEPPPTPSQEPTLLMCCVDMACRAPLTPRSSDPTVHTCARCGQAYRLVMALVPIENDSAEVRRLVGG